MRTGTWRLFLGAFWLLAGIALLFRRVLLPEEFLQQFPKINPVLSGWTALVLSAWNCARWYQTRPRYAVRNPLTPRREETAPYEYIAELDFQKMERESAEKQESPQRHSDTEKQ